MEVVNFLDNSIAVDYAHAQLYNKRHHERAKNTIIQNMPVGRRKSEVQQRLELGLWRQMGLLLGLLLYVYTAPASAQLSGSGLDIWSSAEGSGESSGTDDSGSGDYGMQ